MPWQSNSTLRLPPADRGWRQTMWVILGALMFAGFLVAALVYTTPVLVSDWRVREAARPLDGAEVVKGRCSTKLVLTICDATLRAQGPGGPVTREVNYAFTGLHMGDYSVRALTDPAHPELVTTDLGLDRLWNRTITLALGAALLLSLSVLPLAALLKNRRSGA